MSIKRKENRKDTESSDFNEYEENYSKILFQIEYPTKSNQTLYLLGNIEELGFWNPDRAEKLIKLDENSSLWESVIPLECPVGMTIEYKFLIKDLNKVLNNKELYVKDIINLYEHKKSEFDIKKKIYENINELYEKSKDESKISSSLDEAIKNLNERISNVNK